MKYLLIALLLGTSFYPDVNDNEYQVPGQVPLLQQPKDMDCWITVTTMLWSWRDQKAYTIDAVAKKLGKPWSKYYTANSGLNFNEQKPFIKAAGFTSEPPANYMLEGYLDFLKQYGPLWITTGNGFVAHARLLTGIEGDGSYEKSTFIFINPSNGKIERQNALEFVLEFEEEAIIANEENWEQFRIQIIHL